MCIGGQFVSYCAGKLLNDGMSDGCLSSISGDAEGSGADIGLQGRLHDERAFNSRKGGAGCGMRHWHSVHVRCSCRRQESLCGKHLAQYLNTPLSLHSPSFFVFCQVDCSNIVLSARQIVKDNHLDDGKQKSCWAVHLSSP